MLLASYGEVGLVWHEGETVQPVAMEGVSVDVHVVDFCARTAITQLFRNRQSHAIEATYVFPIDERAAVCGFEAEIDGSVSGCVQSCAWVDCTIYEA